MMYSINTRCARRRTLLILIASVSFSAVSPCLSSPLNWVWQNPLPQGNSLNDVYFTDVLNGIAVGVGGTIIRTTDGGSTWLIQNSGVPATLYGVSFTDVNTGTAVGAWGTILRTTDGGSTWFVQNSGVTETLYGVSFIDVNTGTAVGPSGKIVRTTDGGETWAAVSSGTTWMLRDVTFIDANTGVAVGWNQTIIRTVDGGDTWSLAWEESGLLYSVAFANPDTGLAVGKDGVLLRTVDGGQSWVLLPSPAPVSYLRDVSFLTSITAIAVGGNTVLRTTDAGITWTNVAGGSFNSVVRFGDGMGTAVGFLGAIARTTDGGVTWEEQSHRSFTDQVLDVTFPEPLKGFATTSADGETVLLRTIDGGLTWIPHQTGTTLRRISFPDVQNGVALGDIGMMLRTNDGGETWVESPSGTSEQLSGVSMVDAFTGTAVGKNGAIVRSDDGGVTWTAQASGTTYPLWDVWSIDASTAVAVGDYTVLRTTDSGSTWADVPAGNGNEFLYAVEFADANTGFAIGDFATILRTTDGGLTWAIQFNTWDDADWFNDISLADASNGIAVGSTPAGGILRTTDGGETWVREPCQPERGGRDVYFGNGIAIVTGWRGQMIRAEVPSTVPAALQNFQSYWTGSRVEVSWRLIDIEGELTFDVSRRSGLRGSYAQVHNPEIIRKRDEFIFVDLSTEPATVYSYRVTILEDGNAVTSFETTTTTPSLQLALGQNHPNPFNPETTIRFTLEKAAHVTLSIYDAKGRWVTKLVDDVRSAGPHETRWDGTDAAGSSVSSGVYFYRMTVGNTSLSKRMVLLK